MDILSLGKKYLRAWRITERVERTIKGRKVKVEDTELLGSLRYRLLVFSSLPIPRQAEQPKFVSVTVNQALSYLTQYLVYNPCFTHTYVSLSHIYPLRI